MGATRATGWREQRLTGPLERKRPVGKSKFYVYILLGISLRFKRLPSGAKFVPSQTPAARLNRAAEGRTAREGEARAAIRNGSTCVFDSSSILEFRFCFKVLFRSISEASRAAASCALSGCDVSVVSVDLEEHSARVVGSSSGWFGGMSAGATI